jgi:4-amino-4-deoxy-L-arabinose transferase-like glycosyltransferase
MMQPLLAWILVSFVIAAAYPWSAWLLVLSGRHDGLWLTLLLTLAMSIGTLTLLMFWEAVAGIAFNLWAITLPYVALMLPGWWLWWRNSFPPRLEISAATPPKSTRLFWFGALLLVLISAAILFNGAYWPFHRDDALALYHRYGKLMYETGTLVPFAGRDDAFYQAYPIQIPLAYTYAYLASGWVNEYLAKAIATLFSLACLPAVYVLGRILYGSLTGWLSALLLAFTPVFARWSSTGYVDLPMAFLYTLSAIFAWRLWESGDSIDALLAGAAIGLAAWTKNSGLVGAGLLSLWLIFAWAKRRIQLRQVILALSVCAVIAAPWYVRNWIEARLIVPPTAWIDQAERSLRTLFVFVTQPENFALTGWIVLLAVGFAGIDLLRRRAVLMGQNFLLLWTVPFFVVWWLFVSYDPRFLLLFLPPLCVLGGVWGAILWGRVPQVWQKRILLPLAAIAILWTLYIASISIEFKGEILHAPLMSDAEKHEIVLNNR